MLWFSLTDTGRWMTPHLGATTPTGRYPAPKNGAPKAKIPPSDATIQ
jgi:hypothetical protein